MMHTNDGQVTPKTQPSLDWYADKHGLTDSLVRFYVSFGIVPYVLEGCA